MGHQVNIAILAPGTFRWFLINKQAPLKNKQANRQTNPTWEFSSALALLCFQKALRSREVGCRIRPRTRHTRRRQIHALRTEMPTQVEP